MIKYFEFMAIVAIAFLLVAEFAFAQQPPQQRKETINFEDQLVEGEVSKPDLFFLLQKKQFNFGRLIRLRENFLPELRRSAEDFQRGEADQ